MIRSLWVVPALLVAASRAASAQAKSFVTPTRGTMYEHGDTLVWVRQLDKPDTLGRRADTTMFRFSGDSAFVLEHGRAVKHLSPFLTTQLRFMLSTARDWTDVKTRLALPDSIP